MKFSIVFPGQGSQSVGMLAELADDFACVQDTFSEASAALGFDLWKLVQEGPEEALNQTENTQPAMLAAGVSVWRAWQAAGGPSPSTMAGHSLGEYSALVCGEALDFSDAVSLVAERGRLMQAAVPAGSGAMAAILGLEDEKVRDVCQQAAENEVVEAVNFNAPGQVVIAGAAQAVARAIDAAKSAGARRAVSLPVSVPSHCALMRPAADQLARRLAEIPISTPKIPVVHNVTVETADDPEMVRRLLAQQLYSPVRWVETIQKMAAAGNQAVVEAGPGKVLAGLMRRIDRSVAGKAAFDRAGIESAMQELME